VSDFTVKKIDDMETSFGGGFVLARASLGVTSFGLQVLKMPPGAQGPEHAHRGMTGERAAVANDDQEEVYCGLDGKAYLLLGDDGEVELTEGVMVRCGPEQTRQLTTRDDSATVLAIGAMPGKVYAPPAFTELTAAD
jgi:mannose-6-phosphate isomerase-like protein (cupin superfamily)